MEKLPQSIRELAKQLTEYEAGLRETSAPHECFLVCEKLRESLVRFAGLDAFTALMHRSLALSRAEIPAFETLTVGPEGCVDGLKQISAEGGAGSAAVIIANLLWLLTTFMGQSIVTRLVQDAWPDLQLNLTHEGGENVL